MSWTPCLFINSDSVIGQFGSDNCIIIVKFELGVKNSKMETEEDSIVIKYKKKIKYNQITSSSFPNPQNPQNMLPHPQLQPSQLAQFQNSLFYQDTLHSIQKISKIYKKFLLIGHKYTFRLFKDQITYFSLGGRSNPKYIKYSKNITNVDKSFIYLLA